MNRKCIFLAFTLNKSGFADHFLALTNELINRGFNIVIITTERKIHKVEPNSNPAIFTWPSRRANKLADAIFLAKLLRHYQPVSILSNFSAVNVSTLVAYLFHVPLRYATHVSQIGNHPGNSLCQSLASTLRRYRKALVYRHATKVLLVANNLKPELLHLYHVKNTNIQIFHITVRMVESIIDVEPDTCKNIVFAGGLTYGKGVDTIIQAMPSVLSIFPKTKLEIIGDGEYRQHLETLTKDNKLEKNINFIGELTHEKTLTKIGEACVVIVPSRFDALPKVVLESMARGVPVIATNVGGITEMLRDGIDGYIIPKDDSDILARRIITLLQNPILRLKMGESAREHFVNNFEMGNVVAKQADWLEECISLVK